MHGCRFRRGHQLVRRNAASAGAFRQWVSGSRRRGHARHVAAPRQGGGRELHWGSLLRSWAAGLLERGGNTSTAHEAAVREPLDGRHVGAACTPQVCFSAEDPAQFARRHAEAHRSRARAESLLRYNLYVDSMPTDDIPPLTNEQVRGCSGCGSVGGREEGVHGRGSRTGVW